MHGVFVFDWIFLLFNKQFSNLVEVFFRFSSLFLLPVGSLIASFWAYPVYFVASKPIGFVFNTIHSTLNRFEAWKSENRVFILIIIIFVVFSQCTSPVPKNFTIHCYEDDPAFEKTNTTSRFT